MKVKELQKTVQVAWSPVQQQTIMLAAGTAGQQLDDASSAAVLEVYEANLAEPGYDMVLKGSQTSQYRFHKLVWSSLGHGGKYPNGVIVGGCESGHIQVYNTAKLLANEESLISTQKKHTGPVRALDLNPFQTNLLASGASESDILLWDLNNMATPMTPGTKTQPAEDIQNVGWNRQVQHILASVFSSKCVIWDLRKNEPIIKLSDSQSRVRWRALQWHPEIATQLWLASEEDQAPAVQLWDLRYATAPAKTLQIHSRGILSLSWCPSDTDLMVSCGKDNKTLCWNPNTEIVGDEIQSEIATTIQWYSDVQWCPKNPALIAAASLEGNVSMYSLFGGSQQQVQTSNKIADSFPGMDTLAMAPMPQNQTVPIVYNDLRKPPKWMKRPVGASFAFGGRLVTFNNTSKQISVNQVITEPELVDRSVQLEDVLANGNFDEYCRLKADQMTDQHGRYIWYFLRANFNANPREEMLNLLGYNSNDMNDKFNKLIPTEQKGIDDIDELTQNNADLNQSEKNNAVFDAIAVDHKKQTTEEIPYKIIADGNNIESLICQAILTGKTEAAVEFCLQDKRYADAVIIAMTGGSELLARTQYRYLKDQQGYLSNIISALVTEDWMGVVSQCTTDSWKEALVATLTHSHGQMPELCDRLGERLQYENGGKNLSTSQSIQNAILCYICSGNVEKLVDSWPTLKSDEIIELQELVEIVMLLQKALELQGRSVGASGKLADLLARYAGLLAAQGALNSALTYLGPSDDPQIVDLRERLYYSLGHKQAYGSTTAAAAAPRMSLGGGQVNYNTTNSNSRYQQQPQRPSIPNMNQPTFNNSFQSPVLNSSTGGSYGIPPQIPSQMSSPPTLQPWQQQQQQQPPQQSWQQQSTPQTFQPAPLVPSIPQVGPPPPSSANQPPRPSSVGSQGSAPSTTRSKYLLDPSVQSGSGGYGQTSNFYAPPPQVFNNNQPSSMMMNGSGQVPMIPNNTSTPLGGAGYQQPLMPGLPPQQQQFNTNPMMMTPGPPGGGDYGSGIPPIEIAQQAYSQQQQLRKNPTPPPGWNDPPILKTSRKPYYDGSGGGGDGHHNQRNPEMSACHAGTRKWGKIIKSHDDAANAAAAIKNRGDGINQAPPAPTNDFAQTNATPSNGIFDPNMHQQQQQQYAPPSMMQPTQLPSQQMQIPGSQPPPAMNFQPQAIPLAQQQQQQQQQQQHPPIPNQMNFQTNAVPLQPTQQQVFQPQQPLMPQQQQQQQQQYKPATPEPPKQKAPLPEEYVYMQTVFNELKAQCSATASNPQTKRKLEDVGKRLECLYDLLRDDRLTSNTLTSLNQLVQLVQTGDYANGLGLHTQMVSGPDFSQIASFMPGIKVLLLSAMQLQVYLR